MIQTIKISDDFVIDISIEPLTFLFNCKDRSVEVTRGLNNRELKKLQHAIIVMLGYLERESILGRIDE